MLRSMFYMATAVLLSTKTARSGSYLKTEERKKASSSYRYTRYQVFPNYRTLEPHVTCILERIVDWYCTTSMIAHERKKLEKDDILNYPPPVGTIHSTLVILQNFVKKCEQVWRKFLKYWDLSGAKACKSCRSRQEHSNRTYEYFLAKFGVDTAENEPDKVWSFGLSLIHIWRCRRYSLCRSRWSPYH